jgi:hypothetical protein
MNCHAPVYAGRVIDPPGTTAARVAIRSMIFFFLSLHCKKGNNCQIK